MVVIVSSFWREITKETENTHPHVVFDVQNRMAPVDSREKQKLGILNHIYKGTSETKKDTAVHNKHAYSSKKNHHECLSDFTAYSFKCQE